MKRFVIIGTGHCGTGWISSVLQNLGIACGHESVFYYSVNDWGNLQGDSSAMALPHIEDGFEGAVWLQVRHPYAFIRSQIQSNGLFGNDWGKFLLRKCPEAAKYQHGDNPTLEWAAHFWMDWNKRCRNIADLWWRVESVDEALLRHIALHTGRHVTKGEIANARRADKTWKNSHVKPDTPEVDIERVELLPFFSSLKKEARRFGYRL